MEIWTALQMAARQRLGLTDDFDDWERELMLWSSWTCHLECGHPYVFTTGDNEKTLMGQDRYCNTCDCSSRVYRMERKSR